MVFDQACAQHDTAGWISSEPPTSSDVFPDAERLAGDDLWTVGWCWQCGLGQSMCHIGSPTAMIKGTLEYCDTPKKKYEKDTYCMGLWKFFWYISMEKTVIPPKKRWSAATEHSFTRPELMILMVRLVQDPVDHLLFHSTNPSITQWINRIAQSVNQPLTD